MWSCEPLSSVLSCHRQRARCLSRRCTPTTFPKRYIACRHAAGAASFTIARRRRERRERFDYREKRHSDNPARRHRCPAKKAGIPADGRTFFYCGAAIFFGGILWGVLVCRAAPTKQRFFASARAASSLVTSSFARSLSRNRPPLSPGICL